MAMFGATAQMGIGLFQNIGSFIAQSKQAASDRKWQAYNNKMLRLSNALNQNSITTNENLRKEGKARDLVAVQKAETATLANAEVSAAATGTVGRSVNMVLRDIKVNAASKRNEIERNDNIADLETDQQRLSSEMSVMTQLDLRSIPGPGLGSLLGGMGATLVKYGNK